MSSGEAHGARDVVAAVTADDRIVWPEEWLVAAACSAHHRGDGDTVDRAAGLLDVSAHRNAGIASVTGASLLVTALSTRDYEPALARLADSPRALLATMAQEEFGRFQLTGGDRSVAVDALDAAHDRYTELGATAWATRARRLLQAAGVRRRRWQPVPQRPDSGWEALTTMERQVATLIANGHTNRSAADELTLSPNTVSTHLRSVFTKLDVHSRVQLANLVRDPQE
jgi:DNA-binding NarL/FixJ family response regulator